MPLGLQYLFFPEDSKVYHYRYQYPRECWQFFGRQRKKSLGTKEFGEASRKRALELQYDLIRVNHVRDILARESGTHPYPPKLEAQYVTALGVKHYDDGSGYSVADAERIRFYTADHRLKADHPNQYKQFDVRAHQPWSKRDQRLFEEARRVADMLDYEGDIDRPTKRKSSSTLDERIIQAWIANGNRKGEPRDPYIIKECRDAYKVFQEVAPGKNFATATRRDGRLVAARLRELIKPNSAGVRAIRAKREDEDDFEYEEIVAALLAHAKSATVAKKITWLKAACNLALAEEEDFPEMMGAGNPFSKAVKVLDDEDCRDIYDDHDMRLIYAQRDKFRPDEWLLWVLLASTGMRMDEPFQVAGEMTLEGYRCIYFGSKTRNSRRRLIIPDRAIPYLPARIEGPLFGGESSETLGKRLRRRLRTDIGIIDPAKTPHSLRHRMQTLLDWADVRDRVIRTILGHTLDDLEGNKRGRKRTNSISDRYFNRHHPSAIADAINLIDIGER